MKYPKIDDINLKDFQKWKSNWPDTQIDINDYVWNTVTLDQSIGLCEFLYPRLIEVQEKYIFLERNYSRSYQLVSNMIANSINKQDIELQVNSVSVYDLFLNRQNPIEYDLQVYESFAQVILAFWKLTIPIQIPNKIFEFDYVTEPDSYGPCVSFYEKI